MHHEACSECAGTWLAGMQCENNHDFVGFFEPSKYTPLAPQWNAMLLEIKSFLLRIRSSHSDLFLVYPYPNREKVCRMEVIG